MQIRSKPHGEVACNAIPTGCLQMLFRSGHLAIVHFSSLHGFCSPEWSVLADKMGHLKATEPDKCLVAHYKICTPLLIIKDSRRHAPTSLCPNLSLQSEARHDCSTENQNVLFCSWFCLLWRISAPWRDSTSVRIARWFIYIFPFFICCKAASPEPVLTQ